MLWGQLTSLKYLHHKQHELWGLREGRCFKIQFPLFSSAGAVRKLAIRRAPYGNEMLPVFRSRDAWRTLLGFKSPGGQSVGRCGGEESTASSSLATVRDQYDNAEGNSDRDVIQNKSVFLFFKELWIISRRFGWVFLTSLVPFRPIAASNFQNRIRWNEQNAVR